jgi:hypothetical protein
VFLRFRFTISGYAAAGTLLRDVRGTLRLSTHTTFQCRGGTSTSSNEDKVQLSHKAASPIPRLGSRVLVLRSRFCLPDDAGSPTALPPNLYFNTLLTPGPRNPLPRGNPGDVGQITTLTEKGTNL